MFVLWRWLYETILAPSGTPDHELTQWLQKATWYVLQPFYPTVAMEGYALLIDQEQVITFTTGCNGLELMVLYLAFLLCLPSAPLRMLKFAIGGLVLINLLNIARCTGLAIWAHYHWPLWDFMHHYLFKMVIYGVNFYLWVLYSKSNVLFKK